MQVTVIRPAAPSSARFDTCIVVDVLRATTTAAVLCERLGAMCVVRAADELAQLPPRQAGYALFSELADVTSVLPRFDNSPVQARQVVLDGRTPVLVTTNGTLAVGIATRLADEVLLGAFVNLSAVVEHVVARGAATVAIMPAGHVKNAEARAEDDGCAEALAARLRGAAVDVAAIIGRCRIDPRVERRAREPQIAADIELAFSVDAVPVVPRVDGGGERTWWPVVASRAA